MNKITLKEQRLIQRRNNYFRLLELERQSVNELNQNARMAFIQNLNFKEENRDKHKKYMIKQITNNKERYEKRTDSLYSKISDINKQLSDLDDIRYRRHLLRLKNKEIRDFLETP